MKKLKLLLVACVVTATSLMFAAPSQASTCDDSIEDACRVAATVICKVVAKGQPCLN
jgi:hypothetical protein